MAKVFISYSHRDKALARLLADKLRAHSITVWIDEQDILPGAEIAGSIRAGLEESDTIILLIGKGGEGDSWVRREAALALSQKNKRIIPVLADRDADIPFILRHLNALNLSDSKDANSGAERLARFLSLPPESVPAFGSARSDSAKADSEALRREIHAYGEATESKNNWIVAGSTATAIVSVVAAAAGLWFTEEFDAYSKYTYAIIGLMVGLAGARIVTFLTEILAHRAANKVEASREQQ